MTREDILYEALKFLATHGARGNSFDYYNKRRAEWNGYKEYLFKYLDEKFGITEEEGLSIINNLYSEKLIDAVWEPVDGQGKGHSPNQIK